MQDYRDTFQVPTVRTRQLTHSFILPSFTTVRETASMEINVIGQTDRLIDLCEHLKEGHYVTVDTEFIREKTYWPDLCLIQIANDEVEAIVDPLADGIDLGPLFEIMQDPSILKVFHAARQDLEIFYHISGNVPAPLFDTQVAAMVCGYGDQVGYETLVSKILKRPLDKSSRFADWAMRPLNEKQLSYALGDVTHLRDIYKHLRDMLDQSGRESWLEEEMTILTSSSTYENDPDAAWRRIKARSGSARFFGILKELAAWRELEAQRRNSPRNRIIRDESLLDIAANKPKDARALEKMRGLSRSFAEGKLGQGILGAVHKGMSLKDSELPEVQRKDPPAPGLGPITELLKVLLKSNCEEEGIAPRLIANGSDLEKIAARDFGNVAAMTGWRYEIFGQHAVDLIEGRISLSIDDKRIKVIKL